MDMTHTLLNMAISLLGGVFTYMVLTHSAAGASKHDRVKSKSGE
jgi:hypothetical protein